VAALQDRAAEAALAPAEALARVASRGAAGSLAIAGQELAARALGKPLCPDAAAELRIRCAGGKAAVAARDRLRRFTSR
jgi:hypothetical protein